MDLKKGDDKLGSVKANAASLGCFCHSKDSQMVTLMTFFRHENQCDPPSLSHQGKLITGTKSSLLGCLPGMPNPVHSPAAKEAFVVVLPAIIHFVKPQRAIV